MFNAVMVLKIANEVFFGHQQVQKENDQLDTREQTDRPGTNNLIHSL